MDQDRVHRDTLYSEVWARPMASLAPKYGVSAVFLSRVCARLNIPCPPRGYWARKHSGQRTETPPLPAPTVGIPTEWRRGDQLPRMAGPEPAMPNPKKASAHSAILMGSLNSFISGRIAGDGYLKPAKRNLPDLVVTESSLRRAASVLQKLANSFRDASCRISVACSDGRYTRKVLGDEEGRLKRSGFETDLWSPGRPTLAFIGEVAIGLSIYEQTVEKEMVYLDGRYVPVKEAKEIKPGLWDRKTKTFYRRSTQRVASKRLCLRAYSPYSRLSWEYTWTEDKGSLVRQCDAIVAYLVDRAVTLTLEVERADRQADEERKRWEAERAIAISRHERSLIIQAREDSLQNLLKIIEAWNHDRKLQEFFDEITARSVDMNSEGRAQLLAKVHEAKNLLACADSIEALMSWVSPPPKPAE
ncbi:hypothetical protein GIR22_08670 [Pseudomonas sp. CCM 7891]|uniref:Uncharacterized protein n=1 Tax=Pseudomonas karstica TaxID=1055468 RepID=A0A7X2RSM6_9PSED|nr:hypothetical protein [Pseudomonas karstica]